MFTEEQATWLEHSFVMEALAKVPDNQWSGCAGRGTQGERCRAVPEVPHTRFHQTTSQDTLETQVCRMWPPSHQLVAPSQSLAQPMDVGGHSTSTPRVGSSSCTEDVEQTKNKKQRKEKDPRMSAITFAAVRDMFGGDDGKKFPRQASSISFTSGA